MILEDFFLINYCGASFSCWFLSFRNYHYITIGHSKQKLQTHPMFERMAACACNRRCSVLKVITKQKRHYFNVPTKNIYLYKDLCAVLLLQSKKCQKLQLGIFF